MTTIRPRTSYDHPGPLGPALNLSRVTGWDFHHTAGARDESAHDVAQTGVNRFGRSSYNFHIPSDGTINEMQGLHVGAHNDGENSTRLGLVYPGYFHPPHNHMLTKEQIDSTVWLLRHGHEEWGVPIHGKGHRATDPTACPGDTIVPVIPTIVQEAKNPPKEDDMPLLVRHNDNDTVYQVVADQLHKITSADVAKIVAGRDDWWRAVRSLNDTEFSFFTVVSGGGGDHRHDGRYVKKIDFDGHTHDEGVTGGPR